MSEQQDNQDQGSAATSEPMQARSHDVNRGVVNQLARTLGEKANAPRAQLWRTVQTIGSERALALLAEVELIEVRGGMLLPDGSRRRTPGGVFFALLRERLSLEERAKIFSLSARRAPKPQQAAPSVAAASAATAAPPAAASLIWAGRVSLARELSSEKGEAKVKVTLVGRPGKIITKAECVITSMESTKAPALPKGVPVPPAMPTTYLVYIARKQFEKIAQALQDNVEDKLIVEGFAAYDPELEGMGVYATSVTTVQTQAAKRQAQQG